MVLGASDDNMTQIISNEIKEGDKVVISSNAKKKQQHKAMRRPPM